MLNTTPSVLDNARLFWHHRSSVPTSHTILSPCAPLPWLSGMKTVSACLREVSLVLSISSGVDKKTDGTGKVRGPCYGWQVCLFGLSLISCFPPPRPATTLPIAWPGSDHVEMDQGHFSPESQHYPPHSPLRPTQNTWGKCGLITLLWQEQQLTNLYLHSWA